MPKISVDLPDAEREVIARLVALGRTARESYPSVRLTGANTVVQVQLEASDTGDYPILERAQVRVVAHAAPGKRTDVKELAGDVLNDLVSWAGNANVAGIFPASGRSAVVTDADTGNEMCWVLVRVALRAATV